VYIWRLGGGIHVDKSDVTVHPPRPRARGTCAEGAGAGVQDWRHVYKSLAVLEFLVGHGSESAMREVRSMKRELRHLERFQYIDPQGKDQVRAHRSQQQTYTHMSAVRERARAAAFQ